MVVEGTLRLPFDVAMLGWDQPRSIGYEREIQRRMMALGRAEEGGDR